MKTEALRRRLRRAGCQALRHDRKHDIWINPEAGRQAPVPRHAEIKDYLATHILAELGVEESAAASSSRAWHHGLRPHPRPISPAEGF